MGTHSIKNHLAAALAGACVSQFAGAATPCDLVTTAEATRLLGTTATAAVPQDLASDSPACEIRDRHHHAILRLEVSMIAVKDAARLLQHTDEARGAEVPSLHGEPWYEVSVPDADHPHERRMIIHRDRTNLTLDLHGTRSADPKKAFESVWFAIAKRLPEDDR
jgi:hypothetical protein